MCWNQSISLNTFLFGAFSVAVGVLNRVVTPFEGIYYMSFISMQLVEYFTWKNLNRTQTITLLSKIALGLILIQPVLKAISTPGLDKSPLLYPYLLAYALVCWNIIWYVTTNLPFSMTRADNGHLAWHWLAVPLSIILLWMVFMLFPNLYTKEYLRLFLYILIIGAIYYIYAPSKTWGSLWCWIANILSIGILLTVFKKDICPFWKTN